MTQVNRDNQTGLYKQLLGQLIDMWLSTFLFQQLAYGWSPRRAHGGAQLDL